MSARTEFLLEIGCEELPAGFIDPALAFLERELPKLLAEHRLDSDVVMVDGTPRRLVVVANIAARQADLSEELTGPLWSVAFDASGNPTPAGEGFLKKNNLDKTQVRPVEGKKGLVVGATRTEAGRSAHDVLPAIVESLLPRIPFKKTMRWGDRHVTGGHVFGRPVQWLLALFGGTPLSLRFADVVSGDTTRGHRYHAPAPVKVSSVAEYLSVLARSDVVLSRAERRATILREAQRLAQEAGGLLVHDDALLDLVKNLVEKPWPILGRFDAKFLEVPKEILISEAREHQKYFMVTDAHGALLPCFIVVAGANAKDTQALANGNARVLRARFEDGAFYYRTDKERTLASRTADLSSLVFHKELGHYLQKVERIAVVGKAVFDDVSDELQALGIDLTKTGVDVARASMLAKSDLTSGVVNEFPELQGVIGRYYALADGENAEVAFAIEDHYAPKNAGAALPRSHVAAIVGIADRIDTIVGILGIGKTPTGSADPFALRRAAIAILTIAIEKGYEFNLNAVVTAAVHAYQQQGHLSKVTAQALATQVTDFIHGRLPGVLVDKAAHAGFGDAKDIVEAAIGARAGVFDLPDVWQRVLALAKVRQGSPEGFSLLAATFKRVGNIVKKAREDHVAYEAMVPDEERLELPAERELASSARALAMASHEETLAQVQALRTARLSLLAAIEGRLRDVADFTRLQG